MTSAVPFEGRVFHFLRWVGQGDELALAGVGCESWRWLQSALQFLRQCVVIPHEDVVDVLRPFAVVGISNDSLVTVHASECGAAHRGDGTLGHSVFEGRTADEERIALTTCRSD